MGVFVADHVQCEFCLQVWLVKAGEHVVARFARQVRVHVLRTVLLVRERVHPHPVVSVLVQNHQAYFVLPKFYILSWQQDGMLAIDGYNYCAVDYYRSQPEPPIVQQQFVFGLLGQLKGDFSFTHIG